MKLGISLVILLNSFQILKFWDFLFFNFYNFYNICIYIYDTYIYTMHDVMLESTNANLRHRFWKLSVVRLRTDHTLTSNAEITETGTLFHLPS